MITSRKLIAVVLMALSVSSIGYASEKNAQSRTAQTEEKKQAAASSAAASSSAVATQPAKKQRQEEEPAQSWTDKLSGLGSWLWDKTKSVASYPVGWTCSLISGTYNLGRTAVSYPVGWGQSLARIAALKSNDLWVKKSAWWLGTDKKPSEVTIFQAIDALNVEKFHMEKELSKDGKVTKATIKENTLKNVAFGMIQDRAGALLTLSEKDTQRTPLIAACSKSGYYSETMVQEILPHYFGNINAQDADGKTAAHHAVEQNSFANLKRLCKYHADLTKLDNKRRTVLWYAVATGKMPTVRFILKELYNANVDLKGHIEQNDKDGVTSKAAFDLVKEQYLVYKSYDRDDEYIDEIQRTIKIAELLILAQYASELDIDIVDYLEKQQTSKSKTLLIYAAKNGHLDLIEKLIKEMERLGIHVPGYIQIGDEHRRDATNKDAIHYVRERIQRMKAMLPAGWISQGRKVLGAAIAGDQVITSSVIKHFEKILKLLMEKAVIERPRTEDHARERRHGGSGAQREDDRDSANEEGNGSGDEQEDEKQSGNVSGDEQPEHDRAAQSQSAREAHADHSPRLRALGSPSSSSAQPLTKSPMAGHATTAMTSSSSAMPARAATVSAAAAAAAAPTSGPATERPIIEPATFSACPSLSAAWLSNSHAHHANAAGANSTSFGRPTPHAAHAAMSKSSSSSSSTTSQRKSRSRTRVGRNSSTETARTTTPTPKAAVTSAPSAAAAATGRARSGSGSSTSTAATSVRRYDSNNAKRAASEQAAIAALNGGRNQIFH